MSRNGLERQGVRGQFIVALLAMFTSGLSDSLCAGLAANLQRIYLDPLDRLHSATMIATALGSSFLGYTILLVGCSVLLDKLGMKPMLVLSGLLFTASSVALTTCGIFSGSSEVYWVILAGMFLGGAAHAVVEGTVNPLMGTLFPEGSTHYMSMLHAYYPAGLIAGGVLSVIEFSEGKTWYVLFALIAVFAAIYLAMLMGRRFSGSTSIALGVDFRGQCAELLKRPSFFLWFAIMLFTSTMEIAPREWIDVTLSSVVGMRGILIIVYVALLQFVGRHFAGFFERRLSVEGLLLLSSVLCAVGLIGLGYANSPLSALVAATIWGLGICYIWPVMLSVATDRYPRAGALGVGLMGAAGSISIYVALPILGGIIDRAKLDAAGGAKALAAMTQQQLQDVMHQAASFSFRFIGMIPSALVVVFALMWWNRSRRRLTGSVAANEAYDA
ncbi:MFS transporter [Paraburkholderia sp. Ac-20347]|uniref:MFS transporter n=1 Tax=Paraburkholderia sp. Ac-20347 TaxID=2703892 RepID=UPI0019811E50|nr:MFS transporter [Paraburkholderia sp. Ac-20347]MBN3812512.1 MFS transporter [Paraburkholderia sp. Ac-20347]